MITLYQFATSPFTEKVRRALNYKGIDFEVHEVERHKVPEGVYKDVSPTGKFPAMMVDGQAVWDSTDIIYHLESLSSEKPLLPSDSRDAALAHAIEDWADESLYFYEVTMRLTWEHNIDAVLEEFAATTPGVSPEQLKPMIIQGAGELTQAQGLGRKPREQIVRDAKRHINALDNMLEGRDWLIGDHLSLADLAVIGQLNALCYAQEVREALKETKNIEPWVARLDEIAPS